MTIIATDTCGYGLGAVILQVQQGRRRPVAFAYRSLSDTEQRYAVVEKKALAVAWACEKFAEYVSGTQFTVETDHRPLVPLSNTTDLSNLPARILRFRLRLMRYAPKIVEGKLHCTPAALSRAPVCTPCR